MIDDDDLEPLTAMHRTAPTGSPSTSASTCSSPAARGSGTPAPLEDKAAALAGSTLDAPARPRRAPRAPCSRDAAPAHLHRDHGVRVLTMETRAPAESVARTLAPSRSHRRRHDRARRAGAERPAVRGRRSARSWAPARRTRSCTPGQKGLQDSVIESIQESEVRPSRTDGDDGDRLSGSRGASPRRCELFHMRAPSTPSVPATSSERSGRRPRRSADDASALALRTRPPNDRRTVPAAAARRPWPLPPLEVARRRRVLRSRRR